MGVFTLYELVMYCVKCVIVFAYEIQIGLTLLVWFHTWIVQIV